MIANKTALLAAAAALAEQAVAFNTHRHLHRQVEKRALETNWVTVWETVYYTAGQSEPAATEAPVQEAPVAGVPTTTSTSIVVLPTTTAQPVVAEAPVSEEPASSKTTLYTAIKPATTSQVAAEEVAEPTTTSAAAVQVSVEAVAELAPTTSEPVVATTTSQAAAASSTASESSSSGTSSGSSVGFSSKRGLAYNDADLAATFGASCTSCSWGYNWDSDSYGLDSKYNFIPMLWDNTDEHTKNWKSNVDSAISNSVKAIMSFNEPDNAGQAAMTPEAAAAAHVEWVNPYAGKTLIGAPCVSNSNLDGEGLAWLQSFVDTCDGLDEKCQYDFCPVHWYAESAYADTLFEHLEKAHEICGNKPIWLTEFAPLDTDNASSFLEEVIPKLEALEYLDAYSYFMIKEGNLMDTTTSLSSFGQTYATLS